jgi:hypothetical protein
MEFVKGQDQVHFSFQSSLSDVKIRDEIKLQQLQITFRMTILYDSVNSSGLSSRLSSWLSFLIVVSCSVI